MHIDISDPEYLDSRDTNLVSDKKWNRSVARSLVDMSSDIDGLNDDRKVTGIFMSTDEMFKELDVAGNIGYIFAVNQKTNMFSIKFTYTASDGESLDLRKATVALNKQLNDYLLANDNITLTKTSLTDYVNDDGQDYAALNATFIYSD